MTLDQQVAMFSAANVKLKLFTRTIVIAPIC